MSAQQMQSRRSALRWLLSGAGAIAAVACGPASPAARTVAPAATTPTAAPAAATAPTVQPVAVARTTVAPAAATAPTVQPVAVATTTAAPIAAVQPRTGGTLRMGLVGDLTTLDGHLLIRGAEESIGSVYEKLTAYDDKLQPQPLLAESWEFSSDATHLKFNLRKGVQFHTGREFTSHDVKWNLLRVRDPKVGVAQFAAQSNWFTSIDTPDKYTVILTSDKPRPAVFDLFEQLNMLDSETIEGPDAASKAVGTGPFTFVEWIQGDHLLFNKNQHYWQSGKPYIDSLRVMINSDPQTVVTQFEAGALDAANLPPVRDAVRLQKDPKYRLMINERTGGYYLIALNTAIPPLDNKLVRQALNYAVDRQRFADTVLLGTSQAESLPWPSFAPAYEADKQHSIGFDLDKAGSLLAQAGVSNFELDLVFSLVGSANEYNALGQIYQADLAKLGVKLNLKPLEAAAWRDQVGNHKFNGLNIDSSRFANLESVSVFSTSVYWLPQGNAENFDNATYKQLVDTATTEPDAAKRKQVYSQLNDFVLDQSFVLVLATNPPSVLVRDAVKDLRYSGHDGLLYTDTWLAA